MGRITEKLRAEMSTSAWFPRTQLVISKCQNASSQSKFISVGKFQARMQTTEIFL